MNKLTKKIQIKIAAIFNFLLLSIVYFLGIGLTSIFARIFGKKFLSIKGHKKIKTSFIEFKQSNNLEKMF